MLAVKEIVVKGLQECIQQWYTGRNVWQWKGTNLRWHAVKLAMMTGMLTWVRVHKRFDPTMYIALCLERWKSNSQ